MMGALVPTESQVLPDGRALNNARPGSGRAVATMADALMNAIGFNALRVQTMPIQIGDWTTDDTSSASAIVSTHYLRATFSPAARYIWAGIDCVAVAVWPAATATLSVETAAGVVVDAGVQWTSNGTIPRARTRLELQAAGLYPTDGGIISDTSFVHTGWSAGFTTSTSPRLLDIGANAGADLVLKLVLSNVRAYSLSYAEAYRSEL